MPWYLKENVEHMHLRSRICWVLALLGAAGCGDTEGSEGALEQGGRHAARIGTWTGRLGGPSPAVASAEGKLTLDTAAAVFLAIEQADLQSSSTLLLPVDPEQELAVAVESFTLEDGYFALKGRVEGPPSGIVMLKGTGSQISGWIAFHAEGSAYRYSTEAGRVVVEQVPFRRICPSCDHPLPRRANGLNGATETNRLSAPTRSAIWRVEEPHIGDYPGTDLLKLESRPSATKVLFMDIAPVLDASGTPVDFSKEEMWMAWQSVAAAYSPFEVNVTTNAEIYDATPARNRGKANFTSSNDVAFCYEGVFGSDWDCEIYTGPGAEDSLGYGVGRTTAHEFGHMMGLLDIGTASTAYFEGFDDCKWYPKMGNYYYGFDETNSLFQWSKGEYEGATDFEDALATISSSLPYRDDDIPDTRPLDITGSSGVSSDTNRGLIERNTDADRFTFQVGPSGGRATLTIDRIEYTGGAMLDVQATLQDSAGTTVASSNVAARRSATIEATLAEGTYTLVIEGGAEGTPSRGFSNYGSLGYYGIEGTVTGASTSGNGGSTGVGGESGTAGTGEDTATGGATGMGGSVWTGGASATGGYHAGGTGGSATGGAPGSGGRHGNTGGVVDAATGGVVDAATGGVVDGATGGVVDGATGGVTTGGVVDAATGGVTPGGTASGAGGNAVPATGGATTGGATGTGGSVGGFAAPGAGGNTVSGGAFATGGSTAVGACQTPLGECGPTCVDLSTDALNCGECGTECTAGQSCKAGTCADTAAGGASAASTGASSRTSDDSGCGCTTAGRGAPAGWSLIALGLLAMRRRRFRTG